MYEATIDFAIESSSKREYFVEEAAITLKTIAVKHPFIDGNKRTAFGAAELILTLNGYFIQAEDEECIEFLLSVARKEITLEQIISWIRIGLKRLDEN